MERLDADDRLAIVELAARYNHTVDRRLADEWVALFTDDARLVVNGNTLCEGRDGFVRYIAEAKLRPAKRRHWINSPVIDPLPDGARLRLYVGCYEITDGIASAPFMLGEYDDEAVRTDAGWKFRLRRLTTVAERAAA